MIEPYFQDEMTTLYVARCEDVLPLLERVDVVIADPPYSEHTHKKQWIGSALTANAKPRVGTKFKELGFDPLTPELRNFVCRETARLARRWSLFFSDIEGVDGWRNDILSADLEYIRTMIWDKVDSAPQFTGDRPAASAEAIVVAHPAGKKHWNGGGRRSVFTCPVNGSNQGSKPHPSTKPGPLMRQLVSLFSDEGETILDMFAGSGSTLRAAKDLGRRAIGIEVEEKYAAICVARLRQEVLQFQ